MIEQELDSPLSPLGLEILAAHAVRSNQIAATPPVPEPSGSPAWQLLCLLPLFLLGDVAFGPLTSYDGPYAHLQFESAVGLIISFACGGSIAVQALSLSIFTVFSPGPYWQRLVLLVTACSVLGATGLLGFFLLYYVQGWYIEEEQWIHAGQFVCSLPTIAVAIQLPFWPMRLVFNWRFVRGTLDEVRGYQIPSEAFTVIDYILIAVVCVTCLAGLVMAPASPWQYDPPAWVPTAVFSVIGSVAALIIGIPCILAFSRLKRRWAWSLVLGIPSAIALIGFGIAALSMRTDDFLEMALFLAGMSAALILSFFGGMASMLTLWRAWGWTIQATRSLDQL